MLRETGTVKEIRKALPDVPSASLYRHVKILVDSSILTIVGENRIRSTVESIYQLNKDALTSEDENSNAVQMSLLSICASFARYFSSGNADPKKDMLLFTNCTLVLTDEEFSGFLSEINEIALKYMKVYESFVEQKLPNMPPFKQVGMQMVLFGAKEPKLYQLLFMQENRNAVSFDDVFGELGPTAETCIQSIQEKYHMSEAEAKLLFENVWIYTFGIGALCATRMCQFSERRLGEMLSTEFQAMMLFVKSKAGNTMVKGVF